MADEKHLVLPLQELFFQSVQKFPDHEAVVFSGKVVKSTTYRALGRTVGNLACFFKKLFLRNEVIGVFCRQNVHLATVLLAILQSSAAFYPFCTSSAPRMVLNRLKRHSIRYLLVESCLVENILRNLQTQYNYDNNVNVSTTVESNIKLEVLVPEDGEVRELLNEVQVTLLKVLGSEKCIVEWQEDIAYVMQTSGTTGEPKAVFVPHSCIVPNIIHLSSLFQVTNQDIVFLASPYTFDPFIVQMFLALRNGATLLVVPDADKLVPDTLCRKLFNQHKVTIFQPTPSLLYYIGEELIRTVILSEESCLSVLALGGESCPSLSTLARWKHPKCATRIYNIYGITEVSSWATCYEISGEDLRKTNGCPESRASTLFDQCPLGLPLANTRLGLYDERGMLIDGDGIGHLWIGGHDRKCLLEGETPETIPLMRDSGDIVEVRAGHMRYVGRSDNQLKRFGSLVNLDYIEKAVIRQSTDVVASCAVLVQPTVVGSGLLHFFVRPTINIPSDAEKSFVSNLREHLKLSLPRAAQPDVIHVISRLPLTAHGKVNKRKLLSTVNCRLPVQHQQTPIKEALSQMWLDCCRSSNRTDGILSSVHLGGLDNQSMFILQGGDSILAVRLADTIEHWAQNRWGTQLNMTSLVDVIVNKPFANLVAYVQEQASKSTVTSISNTPREEENISFAKKFKKGNENETINQSISLDGRNSIGPGGNCTKVAKACQNQCDDIPRQSRVGHGRVLCLQCQDRPNCPVFNAIHVPEKTSNFEFMKDVNIKWKTSLNKCIDASPLVVVSSCLVASGEVYIGSHSHLFMAVSLATGVVKWKIALGGRVESSCCLSLCTKFVIVGCYDGKVYVMDRHDGAVVWTHQTDNAVKSSPCVDLRTGFVWVGSHDGNVYALDVRHQTCPITVNCRGGSCFSSPTVGYDPHRVYIGTLGGHFLCIDATTGSTVWCKRLDKPIFGSPLLHDNKVCIATVAGSLTCFDEHGNSLWDFRATVPIFSSPCPLNIQANGTTEPRLIIGSHDHNVYCLSETGKLQWSCKLDSPVYSTPCVRTSIVGLGDKHCCDSGNAVCSMACIFAISTKGTLFVLDANNGSVLKTFVFPGEVFSSPALVGDTLVVGCRDDFLYCLKIR